MQRYDAPHTTGSIHSHSSSKIIISRYRNRFQIMVYHVVIISFVSCSWTNEMQISNFFARPLWRKKNQTTKLSILLQDKLTQIVQPNKEMDPLFWWADKIHSDSWRQKLPQGSRTSSLQRFILHISPFILYVISLLIQGFLEIRIQNFAFSFCFLCEFMRFKNILSKNENKRIYPRLIFLNGVCKIFAHEILSQHSLGTSYPIFLVCKYIFKVIKIG